MLQHERSSVRRQRHGLTLKEALDLTSRPLQCCSLLTLSVVREAASSITMSSSSYCVFCLRREFGQCANWLCRFCFSLHERFVRCCLTRLSTSNKVFIGVCYNILLWYSGISQLFHFNIMNVFKKGTLSFIYINILREFSHKTFA